MVTGSGVSINGGELSVTNLNDTVEKSQCYGGCTLGTSYLGNDMCATNQSHGSHDRHSVVVFPIGHSLCPS